MRSIIWRQRVFCDNYGPRTRKKHGGWYDNMERRVWIRGSTQHRSPVTATRGRHHEGWSPATPQGATTADLMGGDQRYQSPFILARGTVMRNTLPSAPGGVVAPRWGGLQRQYQRYLYIFVAPITSHTPIKSDFSCSLTSHPEAPLVVL